MSTFARVLAITAILTALMFEQSHQNPVSAENRIYRTRLDEPLSTKAYRKNFKNTPICLPAKKGEPEKPGYVGVNFHNRRLMDAVFANCKLAETNFSHAILTEANFVKTDCRGADFSHAFMEGIDVRGANLQDANFRHARLNGMTFDNKTLFLGAHYDKHTSFPIDFVPEAYGMIQDNY